MFSYSLYDPSFLTVLTFLFRNPVFSSVSSCLIPELEPTFSKVLQQFTLYPLGEDQFYLFVTDLCQRTDFVVFYESFYILVTKSSMVCTSLITVIRDSTSFVYSRDIDWVE